jgi:hypothetical protein
LNPARAGLVKDPRHFPSSSYRSYGGDEKGDLVDTEFPWAQFSKRRTISKSMYEHFVKGRIGQGHREDFHELRDHLFLPQWEFVEDIHRIFNENPSFIHDVSVGEIVSEVSCVLHKPIYLFYSITRNRRSAWGRMIVGYIGRQLGSYQGKAIAEHFHRDSSAISQGIERVEKETKKDSLLCTFDGRDRTKHRKRKERKNIQIGMPHPTSIHLNHCEVDHK